jgi:G3E family GTPase
MSASMVAAHGYPVREITDGCFCCRFDSLVEAAESLTGEMSPDVLLAEPVGSGTDLRATIQLPLERLYGDAYRVAPLSVLVDPLRAARAFGDLIANLRAEDDPERLLATLLAALADATGELEVPATVEQEAHFRPGRPVPTHRMETA